MSDLKRADELSEAQAQMLDWSRGMSFLIAEIIGLCRPFLGPGAKLDDRTTWILWKLTASCHSTSESALVLVGNNRLWDADILVRSVVEGTFKFVFLTIGDHAERAKKLHEFDEVLFDMGLLKEHSRLEAFLAVVGNPDADEWRPFREMLLSSEQVETFLQKYPKKFRKLIEQKWSFAKICESLKQCNIKGYDILYHLFFNYGMSSHIAHQDITGIGMVWDRNGRSVLRREAVELAHASRMVSDIAIMSWLRAYALLECIGEDKALLMNINERITTFQSKTMAAAKYFHEVEYGSSGKSTDVKGIL